MVGNIQGKVHDLIRAERRKHNLPHAYWSRKMAYLAQSQANYCAKVGHMVHSDRYAFQGGENIAEGGSNFTPKAIVDCWMHSKAGHREYLLSPRVTKAGVGIAKRTGKTFAAWAFSSDPPSRPDCPKYKGNIPSFRLLSAKLRKKEGKGMLRIVLGIFGLWLVVLGIHGVYIHFSIWEMLWSGADTADKLFLSISMPSPLNSWVLWMTGKGFQSWLIPAGVAVGGLMIMSWVGFTGRLSDALRKLRLW